MVAVHLFDNNSSLQFNMSKETFDDYVKEGRGWNLAHAGIGQEQYIVTVRGRPQGVVVSVPSYAHGEILSVIDKK